MENNYSMLIIWLFPLIGGIIGFYLGKKNKSTRNDWVDIVMFVELIMLGCMGYQIAAEWSTLSMSISNVFGFELAFEMDRMRLGLCALVTIVFAVVSQFMKESMKEDKGSNRFYLLYMGVYSMCLGAVLTPNLFNLFFFVTAALLLAYPMIIHGQDKMAVKNAGIYLAFIVGTIALFLVSLVLILGYVGALDYEIMFMAIVVNGSSTQAVVAGFMLLVIFAVYAGLFPVQFMVTRGCSYGRMEVSGILAGVISKLGVLGMMILAVTIFSDNTVYGNVLLVIAILGTIWGLLIAFSSTDIRKILMGLDIAVNGLNAVGVALMSLTGESGVYTARGSMYLLMVSSLSLMVLYMVAIELVGKTNTFEIKGMIASGKGRKVLMAACFFACASLIGIPGTAGYLAYSLIYKTIVTTIGWKWLIGLFVVMWACYMTAVSRVFMKLFVSKKDETVLILSTEEEVRGNAMLKEAESAISSEEKASEKATKKKEKDPYFFGEVLLLLIGILQIVLGVVPNYTVDKVADAVEEFLFLTNVTEPLSYYTADGLFAFVVAAILAVLLYVNLVHGVLLRAIRNKKNKELKERME